MGLKRLSSFPQFAISQSRVFPIREQQAESMEKKRMFEPGDVVTTFTGQLGIVISEKEFSILKNRLREGRRPGHYFAPGCCQHPDYVIQVPVLFEDATWDVMRTMNIKRTPNLSEEIKAHIQGIRNDQIG